MFGNSVYNCERTNILKIQVLTFIKLFRKLFLFGNEFEFGKYVLSCSGSNLEKEISFGSVEWLTNDFFRVIFGPFLFHFKLMLFWSTLCSLCWRFLLCSIYSHSTSSIIFALKLSSNVVSYLYFFGFGLCIYCLWLSFLFNIGERCFGHILDTIWGNIRNHVKVIQNCILWEHFKLWLHQHYSIPHTKHLHTLF